MRGARGSRNLSLVERQRNNLVTTQVANIAKVYKQVFTRLPLDIEREVDAVGKLVAASIIAKVTRDREMELIERKLGIKIGSGYPGDRGTVEVIKANLKSRALGPYLREYWKTIETIRQRRIGEFPSASNLSR